MAVKIFFLLKLLHCVYRVEYFCKSELPIQGRKASLLIKFTSFKRKFPSTHSLSLVLHFTCVTLTSKAVGWSRVPMVGGSFPWPQQRAVVSFQPQSFSLHPSKQQLLSGGGQSFESGWGSEEEPAPISKGQERSALPLLLFLSLSLSLQDHVHC